MTDSKPPALHTDAAYLAALAGLEQGRSETMPLDPAKCSIAVLPFDNMSGDPEQEYFADGIAEDLLTELSRHRHLAVVSRNSSFVYKGKAVNAQAAGRELGADFILEGSVRKAGNRIRVTAQLIDCTSGSHAWAERYDRQIEDIFALQDEIVTAILGGLHYNLDDAVAAQRQRNPTTSTGAYTAFLRARTAWRNSDEVAARNLLGLAIEADPTYARALAYLAFFNSWSRFSGTLTVSYEEAEQTSRNLAERALVADSADSYVLERLAMSATELGEPGRARILADAAMALNPRDIEVRFVSGMVDICLGQVRQGLAVIDEAIQLEQRMTPGGRLCQHIARHICGDFKGALASLRLIVNPRHYVYAYMANSLARLGHIEDARHALAECTRAAPANFDIRRFVEVNRKMFAKSEDAEAFLRGYRELGLAG